MKSSSHSVKVLISGDGSRMKKLMSQAIMEDVKIELTEGTKPNRVGTSSSSVYVNMRSTDCISCKYSDACHKLESVTGCIPKKCRVRL